MANDERKRSTLPHGPLTRREFLVTTTAVGATTLQPEALATDSKGKRTFTILHTTAMHFNLIGMGPSTDYTPFSTGDEETRGGLASCGSLATEPAREGAHEIKEWQAIKDHPRKLPVTGPLQAAGLWP